MWFICLVFKQYLLNLFSFYLETLNVLIVKLSIDFKLKFSKSMILRENHTVLNSLFYNA